MRLDYFWNPLLKTMSSSRLQAELVGRRKPLSRGFSLIEILAGLVVVSLLMTLLVTALPGTKQAADITKACYDIAGMLQVARTYATTNNTYVWVGFFEENISTGGGNPGIGRLVISTVTSRDGTSIYSQETATAATASQALPGASLVQIGKILKIDNIHLMANPDSVASRSAAFSNRQGKQLGASSIHRLGSGASYTPLFSFQYPLMGTAQYVFGKTGGPGIVQFNPMGEAITDAGPVPGVVPCKEIAIQQTHGTVIDSLSPNIAAIDIAGITGAVTIYRQ